MPKAVDLHGAVAAVTQQGAESQVKGKGQSQDLIAGKMGNQLWQHEQYPQCKRMETGIFLPMGKAINQP